MGDELTGREFVNACQFFGRAHEHRLEQHGVDDAEHGSVQADADGQSEDGRGGKAGTFDERAKTEANVLHECEHRKASQWSPVRKCVCEWNECVGGKVPGGRFERRHRRRRTTGLTGDGVICRLSTMMSEISKSIEQTGKPLAELGVTSPEQLAALFAGLRAEFDGAAASVNDEGSWKTFRDAWLGRKSGVIANITDNWLKKAPTPELKKAVGQALNEFRAHVEAVIEER